MIVKLVNIQSIAEASYVLPEKGLVQIIGGNSNGKSILFKAVTAVALLKILDQEERMALIRDGEQTASIAISANGKLLFAKLSVDRNACLLVLQRDANDSSTQVARYFREGGLRELLDEFGFRCYANNSLCLQSHETYGLMPFVNTSKITNGEIVESATTDSVADLFLKNYKELTHKAAKEQMSLINSRINNQQMLLQSLVFYDYKTYEAAAERLESVWRVFRYLTPVTLEEITILPPVTLIDIHCELLEEILFLSFYEKSPLLEDLSDTICNLSKLLSGSCPTCGKPFVEGSAVCQR